MLTRAARDDIILAISRAPPVREGCSPLALTLRYAGSVPPRSDQGIPDSPNNPKTTSAQLLNNSKTPRLPASHQLRLRFALAYCPRSSMVFEFRQLPSVAVA